MNKKIFTLIIFSLLININLASAENKKNNDPKPTQTKNLTSRLERLYKLNVENKEYMQFARRSDIEIIEDRVVVAVLTKPGITTADIDENDLKSFGAQIQAKAKHSMSVEIPISELVNVATAVEEFAHIRLPIKPVEHAVTSEGVALMNADAWHAAGVSGSGVKVAVIDLGFDSLSEAQAAGDIPASYTSHDFTGGGLQTTTPHGTAVTEAIFDLVPNAEFYLYKISNQTHFENAIDSCINNGVDIINHSCGWFNALGYYDGNGLICSIVDTAINHGILWVNSAGNSARHHYRATAFSETASGYHIFSGGTDTINPTGPYADGQYVSIRLNWDDYPLSGQDYDLYLVQDTGSVTTKWVLVDSSTDNQDGTRYPEEKIDYINPDGDAIYGVIVKNVSAGTVSDFTLFSLEQDFDNYIESSSLPDPGTVTDVVTVGAINRLLYNTTEAIEYFSSRGPTNDGRIKPDVAAPDNCICHAYGGRWYGTSLASPHTAGVCALIKSRYSSFSDTNTREYLYNNCADDVGPSGKDNTYGYGKVVMPDIDITVTSPNGGENWYIDSLNNITWTSSGTSGGVKIEYSSDNGASWSDVVVSMPDTGIYPWTIPNTPSDTCLVRITDTIGSPSDTSDAVFEISHPIPDIAVTSPNGGEVWYIDSTYDITWTSFATSGGVKIEYSIDSASSWTDVIVSMPDTGAYPWTVPDNPSISCVVRVIDTNESVSDTSDAWFEISPTPYITLTTPNGGEIWHVDSIYDITWTTNLTTETVKIEYSTNNGADWSEVVATKQADTLAYPWTIPNTPSDSCLVRIFDTTGFPSDTSDSVFTILPIPYITVTNPNGGENWYIDSTYDITWTTNLTTEAVRIEYSTDNGSNWSEIIASIQADSLAYAWTIPNTSSDSCLVRITDTTGSPSDTSDAIFSISPSSGVPTSQNPGVYSMAAKTITIGNQLEVKYGLPEKADVRFEIYDIKGTKLGEISEEHNPGFYSIKIDMIDKPAGVYFLIMDANKNKFTASQKVVLVK
ncbi:S8 family serine peptidase [candidate division WOR-3 bacterium]|nr:S8 family serine peptidase [candidate division WOR-3 bacterium]